MTEKEKCQQGLFYDANYDPELIAERQACCEALYDFNALRPSQEAERKELLRKILGKTKENLSIISPFFCDYGYNVEVGENFFANTNCVILDEAKVKFGDNVFIGPNCGFYTAEHPLDAERRNKGLEKASPITIGDNVWLGGNVTVLPGVSIGNNTVIGAGSVVVRDIPDGVVAVGNPCRVVKKLTTPK